MSEKLNEDRHYYFYAKHHYLRSDDIFDDLRVIHSEWNGIELKYVTKYNVIERLISIVKPIIESGDGGDNLFSLIADISPLDRLSGKEVDNYNFDESVANACLIILGHQVTSKIKYNLGEPDFNLLKKS